MGGLTSENQREDSASQTMYEYGPGPDTPPALCKCQLSLRVNAVVWGHKWLRPDSAFWDPPIPRGVGHVNPVAVARARDGSSTGPGQPRGGVTHLPACLAA